MKFEFQAGPSGGVLVLDFERDARPCFQNIPNNFDNLF